MNHAWLNNGDILLLNSFPPNEGHGCRIRKYIYRYGIFFVAFELGPFERLSFVVQVSLCCEQ